MTASARQSGVLLLIHRGFSFVDDLAEVARARELDVYILSSQPAAESRAVALAGLGDWCHVTGDNALTQHDVQAALEQLRAAGRPVAACITVWEGYRRLMAEVNAHRGAVDILPESVDLLQDKYTFRRRLADYELTEARARLLTPEVLDQARRSSARTFVKPRYGLASFASFPLDTSLSWTRLQALREEMAQDPDFAAYFATSSDFIVEDYIPGVECSFEVACLWGEPFVIAVHEKSELDQTGGAMLEAACVSPPLGVAREDLGRACERIAHSARVFGLHSGVYHIEARLVEPGGTWELVEINPRIGGSLINASVKAQDPNSCLLALWLDIVLNRDPVALRSRLRADYSDMACLDYQRRSFFRVYFGEPGKRVATIEEVPVDPPIQLFKALVPNGSQLPQSSRELFLAQALWSLDASAPVERFQALHEVSQHAVRITYE